MRRLLMHTFLFSFFVQLGNTDGRRLPQNHRQKAWSNGTLVITDVQKSSDWGRYECLVFDGEGHSVRRDLIVNVMGKKISSLSLLLSLSFIIVHRLSRSFPLSLRLARVSASRVSCAARDVRVPIQSAERRSGTSERRVAL